MVEEAFSSGAVRLKGAKDTWIVNGQRLKPYLASEQKTVEVIDTITMDEHISNTYGKDLGFSRTRNWKVTEGDPSFCNENNI